MSKYNSKCPLNCNQKGCGTHICQKYADYQQGRTDAIAEISKEMRVLYGNEYEKQIRAEAIEECIKLTEECVWKDTDMLIGMFKQMQKGTEK